VACEVTGAAERQCAPKARERLSPRLQQVPRGALVATGATWRPVATSAHSLQRAVPAATWTGAREHAHTPSATQRGGGWSALTCACTATASSLERCASPRQLRADRGDAAERRCCAPSLLAANRTPCVPRSVAPDTCRVVVRRVLLSVASRHGIYFHLVCEDALEAARRMCSPANAMLRVSVTTVRVHCRGAAASSPRKQQGQVEQLRSVGEAGQHAEESTIETECTMGNSFRRKLRRITAHSPSDVHPLYTRGRTSARSGSGQQRSLAVRPRVVDLCEPIKRLRVGPQRIPLRTTAALTCAAARRRGCVESETAAGVFGEFARVQFDVWQEVHFAPLQCDVATEISH
jgi:hypothetical protein